MELDSVALQLYSLWLTNGWYEDMGSVADRELELKLELTQQEMQRIGAHPALETSNGRPTGNAYAALHLLRHARP